MRDLDDLIEHADMERKRKREDAMFPYDYSQRDSETDARYAERLVRRGEDLERELAAMTKLNREHVRQLNERSLQPEGMATSGDSYFAGIQDAISYLGGCTFGASEMSTVRGVLSLLKSFKRQGGYSAYKQLPQDCSQGEKP